jgi:predicted signal transduction protein with EAL and GGDEF domain
LSIGISIYSDDGIELNAVMQTADTAMYHAKKNGCNNFQFFRANMNTRAACRLLIEINMRRALKRGEFVLNYQP